MVNLLKLYLDKKGYRPTDLANLIGVTPSAVSSWLSGRAKPRIKIAKRIKRYCDAPLSIWGYREDEE